MALKKGSGDADGEFLWLMSLSDLMILLFIFFVVLYSFAAKKLKETDYVQMLEALGNKEVKDPIGDVQNAVKSWIAENDLSQQIDIVRENGEILVQIKDKALFGSGEYRLKTMGVDTMSRLARALEGIPKPYKLAIEGHTDDVPIRTREISNNFDLSSKRAIAVYNALGFSEDFRQRVVISAYGDTQPVAKNRGPDGSPIAANQSRNRRVTLKIY